VVRTIALSLLLFTSCRRSEAVAKKDPTPSVDAKPIEPTKTTHALVHGRIVDVATGQIAHLLREKKPRAELLDAHGALTLDVDDQLRAWNVANGKERWSIPTRGKMLASDAEHAFVAEPTALAIVERATGSVRRLMPGGTGDIDELRVVPGHVITRQDSRVVVMNATTGAVRVTSVATTPIEAVIEDRTRGLAVASDSFCFAQFVPPDHLVQCLDLDGKTLRRSVVALKRPGDPSMTSFALRFISPHHIVIGTWGFGAAKSARRSGIVRLSDGAVTIIEDEVAALVERADGTLEGLLVSSPEVKLLSLTGAVRFTYKMKHAEEFAAVALIDDRLVIAGFNAIATGVQVFALRLADGTELWKGETKLPPISHSKYRNIVTLAALGDAAILRGDESSVDHVHVYDSKTGALRFNDAQ